MTEQETDQEIAQYGCTLAALELSQPIRLSRLKYVQEILDEAEGRLHSEADMGLARQLLNRAKHLLKIEDQDRADRWRLPVAAVIRERFL